LRNQPAEGIRSKLGGRVVRGQIGRFVTAREIDGADEAGASGADGIRDADGECRTCVGARGGTQTADLQSRPSVGL
jgi:hypothetical protein